MLVIHTDLGQKDIAHFLSMDSEHHFTEEECATRHEALGLQAITQEAYRTRAYFGLKQNNGKDDWTLDMDRTLCVLVNYRASDRLEEPSYDWLEIAEKINDVFMPTDIAGLGEALPERATTVRNARARWNILTTHLVGRDTIMQEVGRMKAREIDEFMEIINAYPVRRVV